MQELPEDVGDKEVEIKKETHEIEAPPTEEHDFERAMSEMAQIEQNVCKGFQQQNRSSQWLLSIVTYTH